MTTLIVYGPQGTGKTLYANEIANYYGCSGIVDDWYPGILLTPGFLHLSNENREAIGNPKVRKAYDKQATTVPVIHIEAALLSAVSLTVEEALKAKQSNRIQRPVTDAQFERLTLLIEECAEVIQEATKIQRFGFNSFHPDDETREPNGQRLMREMTDLRATYDILTRAGDVKPIDTGEIQLARQKKVLNSLYQDGM